MNVSNKRKSQGKANASNNDVPLFPKKIQFAIIMAFIAVILGIVATTVIIVNMVFNPSISTPSKSSDSNNSVTETVSVTSITTAPTQSVSPTK